MADQKLTQLTENTTPTLDDMMYLVDNPAGTPSSQKVSLDTLSQFWSYNAQAQMLMANRNFNVWQNGTSFTNPADGDMMADIWKLTYVNNGTLPTTITHSRQAHTPGDVFNSFYYYRIAPNAAGSGFGTNDYYLIHNRVEYGTRMLAGASKTITLTFYGRCSIANKRIGVQIAQVYGTGGSPTTTEELVGTAITLTSSWVKYTVTFTLNTLVGKTFGTNNDDYLIIRFFMMWGTGAGVTYLNSAAAELFGGNGTIDLSQVYINPGSVSLPFIPRSQKDDLAFCQRYFEKSFPYGTAPAQNAGTAGHSNFPAIQAGATTQRPNAIQFKVTKRTTPTVTIYNPSATNAQARDLTAAADCSSTTVGADGDESFRLSVVGNASTAVANTIGFHWKADATL